MTKVQISEAHGAQVNTRPTPDVSRFISASDLAALARNTDVLNATEEKLRDIRRKYEPKMSSRLGPHAARDCCELLETNIARLALAKSLHGRFKAGVSGKYTDEKADTMIKTWFLHLQAQGPAFAGLAESCGVKASQEDIDADAKDEADLRIVLYLHDSMIISLTLC